jgi:hypothetical protein
MDKVKSARSKAEERYLSYKLKFRKFEALVIRRFKCKENQLRTVT